MIGCGGDSMFHHYEEAETVRHIGGRVIPVWIDGNFDAMDKEDIGWAISQWNYALNGEIVIEVEDINFDMDVKVLGEVKSRGGWVILKIDRKSKLIMDEYGYMTLAFVNDIGGNEMYIVRDRILDGLGHVAMHEMGHLLGAEHDGGYLMQPHYSGEIYGCIDYFTMTQVARKQGIVPARMNYCIYE